MLKPLENGQQTVDESIEVGDDVGVQVVYDANGKLSRNALVLIDLAELPCGQFAHKQLALHIEVVICQLCQLSLDFLLLLSDQLSQTIADFPKHKADKGAFLQTHSLDKMLEVASASKLFL